MIAGLLVVLLLSLPMVAHAAITEVGGGSQRKSCAIDNTSTPLGCSFTSNVGANSFVAAGGGHWHTSAQTVTTTGSGTACSGTLTTVDATTTLSWAGGEGRGFLSRGQSGGSSGTCTLSVDPSGTGNYISFHINEWTGHDTGSPLDVDGGTSAGSGTSATDTITTGVANALILGVLATQSNGAFTQGGSYTLVGEDETAGYQANALVFRIVTSATTYTVDWTLANSEGWTVTTISIKPASVAAAAAGGLLLRGVGP